MASTTLQCTPLPVGRGWEGGCCGGTAMTQKCNSSATAVAARFHRNGSGGFEEAFLSGGGKRGAAAAKPVPALRSLSKSLSFGGLVDSPRHRDTDVLRCPSWESRKSSRASRVQGVQAVPGNVEMLETYEIESKVRGYELDHCGVVNNAIYARFCQQARTELLENIGFYPDAVTESGRAMAISDMSMKFVSPLRSGDRYIVSSRVAGTTAVRLIFEDHIYRLPERELVMSAKSTVVVLDQNSKPGRLPDEIKVKLVHGYKTNHGKPAIGHVNDSSTNNGHVHGNSTSGHVNGNSTNGHVNGNSTNGHVLNRMSTNGHLNGNSTNGHVNGYSVNSYINGISVNGHVNGNSTNGHVSGNSDDGHVKGNSRNNHVNFNSVNGNVDCAQISFSRGVQLFFSVLERGLSSFASGAQKGSRLRSIIVDLITRTYLRTRHCSLLLLSLANGHPHFCNSHTEPNFVCYRGREVRTQDVPQFEHHHSRLSILMKLNSPRYNNAIFQK